MDVRTGFVTQRWMDRERALAWAGDHGFDYVEILMDGDDCREQLEPAAPDVRAAAERMELDLAVHLPFPMDIGSPHEHAREGALREQEACLALAGELGAEKAVLHPESGAWSAAWSHEQVRPHVDDAVRRLTTYGADRGVEICAENLFDKPYTIHEMDRLLERTDVSMTLDTGHARVEGADEEAVASFLETWGDRVSHVHLNDTRRPYDEHLPFGAGDIDFRTELGALGEDWTGTLSLEVFTPNFDFLAISKERLDDLLASL
jgi:sugar phosphate isomerase/epimerase